MKPKSDTLFHFTSKLDYLKSILAKGLQPRICHEDISFLNGKQNYLSIPMVCFCDIPISRLTDHTSFYGTYGIGLTRNWAEKNEVHPISYTSKSGPLADTSRYLLKKFQELKKSNTGLMVLNQDLQEDLKNQQQKIKRLMAFSKPYRGKQKNQSTGKEEKKTFFEENEWRFVPNDYVFNDLSGKPEKLESQNNLHSANPLKFEPEDIRYIFVKSETEINEIFDFVLKTYKKNSNQSKVKNLLTRITCLESIGKDL